MLLIRGFFKVPDSVAVATGLVAEYRALEWADVTVGLGVGRCYTGRVRNKKGVPEGWSAARFNNSFNSRLSRTEADFGPTSTSLCPGSIPKHPELAWLPLTC